MPNLSQLNPGPRPPCSPCKQLSYYPILIFRQPIAPGLSQIFIASGGRMRETFTVPLTMTIVGAREQQDHQS